MAQVEGAVDVDEVRRQAKAWQSALADLDEESPKRERTLLHRLQGALVGSVTSVQALATGRSH